MLTKPAPILHCDWLQLHIKRVDKISTAFHPRYEVKAMDFATRHFKLVEEVFYMGRRMATLTSKPRSGILDPDSVLVKFDNWLLYDKNFRVAVDEFIKLNGFYFISCSRVDFCADFNEFDNDMKPMNFMRKFIFRKFLKVGKAKNVQVRFDQGKDKHLFSGLKFGSNLSEVTYYLYNKSKELREETMKPWIVQSWRDGGLRVSEDSLNYDDDVYRLEFSVKSGAKLILDKETGQVDLMLTLEVMKHEIIVKLFSVLYHQYFTFFHNDGQVRKDRMRKLKLFNFLKYPEVLINVKFMRDSKRSDKIFIKKLYEINNELRGRDIVMCSENDKLREVVIADRCLQSWAMSKGFN